MGIQINGQTDTVTSTTSGGTVKITPASINATGVSTFSDIRITGGTIAGVSTAGITTAYIGSVNDGPISGARNRIINGDMRIDQRNAGASVTPTSSGYTLDRWIAALTQASKYSVQQSTTAPTGFGHSLLVTSLSSYSAGAGDFFLLRHYIEGFNFSDLAWGTASAQTITLSFWVRSSLTGTFGGSLQNSAETRSYPFTYTISAANTWEQKTLRIAGETSGTWIGATNGVGVRINFGLGVGSTYSGTAGAWAAVDYRSATGATSVVGTSGATFYITGVQLEPGTVATPFERRSYGQELALCQRYYWRAKATDYNYTCFASGYAAAVSAVVVTKHPVTMRVTPTILISNTQILAGGATGAATFNSNASSPVDWGCGLAGSWGAGGSVLRADNNTNAYIDAVAEL